MNRSTRWSVAFGAGILLSLGLLSPVATATASPASSTASLDRSVEIPARSLFDRAVTPSECSATMLDEFFFSELAAMTDEEFDFLVAHQDAFFGVPTYDPLFFGTADDPDYALTLHARQLQNTFRDVKKFWTGMQVRRHPVDGDARQTCCSTPTGSRTRCCSCMVSGALSPPLDTATPAQLRAEAVTVATFLQENWRGTGLLQQPAVDAERLRVHRPRATRTPQSRRSPTSSSSVTASSSRTTPSASATWARVSSWATSSPTTSSSSSASSTPARPTRPRPRAGPS